MQDKITQANVLEIYTKYIGEFGAFVNRRRATPDVKDGLKPIHRRIIYDMYAVERATDNLVKSKTISGSVLRFHPHGDSAVYDSMKPMTNWYEITEPLLEGSGNWGNMQGDKSADARYTDSKLSQFAIDCVIGDLATSSNAVDWVETYDGRNKEPEFLPTAVPLILINGTFGIGVGLKSLVPPHPMGDVIDATINLIKNPSAPVILIPDQYMGCEIVEGDWKAISNTGRGSFIVRGIIDIENTDTKPMLVIRTTPDRVNANSITEKIENMKAQNLLPQVEGLIDTSTTDDMRIEIILRKGSDANYVRDLIYKKTEMQTTVTVNFEIVDGLDTARFNYKSYLQYFIEFRKNTKFRLFCNKLQEIDTRIHERQTYITLLESGKIDEVIKNIRLSIDDDKALLEYLTKELDITPRQASYILRANISKLSLNNLNKYKKEAEELEEMKNKYITLISDEKYLDEIILEELQMFKDKYAKPRKSKIIGKDILTNVPKGEFKLVITENNFIKKISLNETLGSFKGDTPKFILKGDNTENIIIFDELGKVHKLPIHKIPVSEKSSNGIDIRSLSKNLTGNIIKVLYEPAISHYSEIIEPCSYYLVVVMKSGLIKKLSLKDFLSVPLSGLLYSKIANNDKVKGVEIIPDLLDVIVYSKNKGLRIPMSDIPYQKRNTKGNKSMSDCDNVEGISVMYNETTDIIIITNNGYINRVSAGALQSVGRNKNGSNLINLSRGDSISVIYGVTQNDKIRIVTNTGVKFITASDYEIGSSISKGTKILGKNEYILKSEIFIE